MNLRRYATLIGFAAILLFFAASLPDTFLAARNLLNVSRQVSMLAVVAFAMTAVMAMGDFDLSVGSMASLAGVAAALGVGLAGGLLNGVLVATLGILPFVATLGTPTMFSGAALYASARDLGARGRIAGPGSRGIAFRSGSDAARCLGGRQSGPPRRSYVG